MPCETISDKDGTSYYIPQVDHEVTPGGRLLPGSAGLEVWWSRLWKNESEKLLIRQDNQPDRADVVEVTLGQLYDLIDALNKAVETA